MHTKKDTTKSEVALREEAMLEFWREHDIFKKSIDNPAGQAPVGEFVFYDGPPFATGLPHYGHILAGTIKDAVPRFWTMRGYRVRRKWGWDCHGLPLENLIEKKLGLSNKRDIEDYGIKNFNEQARNTVLEFRDDWREIIPRMGRFVDMDDDYRTMDSPYTESVWWVFKQLHEKGLVYEGFKSMHLCPRCGTTLSNFEVNQGYKDIKDISVYVKLKLHPGQSYGPQYETKDTAHLLVWTTTPWTLPGNMAAAVNEESTYAAVRTNGELLIIAKDNVEAVMAGVDFEMVHDDVKGSDLVGLSYDPPFSYYAEREFENKANAWKIYGASYVEVGGAGSGAVHLAPAYGEEDMELAKVECIPIVHHVDYEGRFMPHVTDFAGRLVKPKDDDDAGVTHLDTDIEIVKALKERDRLFKKENITHSYPHCWRDDTPLLNYATTSWFVEVTKIKDLLITENAQSHWVPEHVGKNRFGKWLEGARDWAVSRQRYWGAPLPIWRNPESEHYHVFGSLAELQKYVRSSGNQYIMMRHGEAESNVKGVVSANKENQDPLTEHGRSQVTTAAAAVPEDVDLIIHSGFMRTKETAELVAEMRPGAEVVEDDSLRELDIADSFEGKHWDDYNNQFASWEERFTTVIPGSENRRDAQIRMGAWLAAAEEKYQNKKILIVSHAGMLFALESAAQGMNAKMSQAHFDAGCYMENAEVRELSYVPHPHNDNFELDFHRPYIDDIRLYDGDVLLERVPDVFDCWFESGSMPYAETHYPFENLEVADPASGVRFPADFISESVDQTRGWFYSLMVLGVALFGKAPFKHVITNGLVLAEDGKKMSKKLQNYPDPMHIADTVGTDAMRYYLLSSSIIRGEDLNFSEKEVIELQRKNIGRLHNVLAMYEQYADGTAAHDDSTHILDTWILARLDELVTEVTRGYERYELDRATRPITDFIDDVSVWYLRRSRDRLKGDDLEDKQATLATLRLVLKELAQTMAPVMPFYAEYLWQHVKTGTEAESVHLSAWPEREVSDSAVIAGMATAREVVTAALEIRAKESVKVRQPLNSLTTNLPLADEYISIVADEVNVKTVTVDSAAEPVAVLDLEITPALKAEGEAREFMRAVQDLRKKADLAPEDKIVITVHSTAEGEALLTSHNDEIMRVTGAASIQFADVFVETDGAELKIGTHVLTVAIEKVTS